MISVGKSYKVMNVKEGTSRKGEPWVILSLGNSEYKADTKSWINKGFINVFVNTGDFYSKGDKVELQEITGIDTSEYNGKTSITIFAKVKPKEEFSNYDSIPSDELPF